jgi:hypothetical protein
LIVVAVVGGYLVWQRGCRRELPAIDVSGGAVVVRNQTAHEWRNVRIWVNDYYSGTAARIPAGGSVREPVTRFVAAQGQRLSASAGITSVVVLGTAPDGTAIRVVWGEPFWH